MRKYGLSYTNKLNLKMFKKKNLDKKLDAFHLYLFIWFNSVDIFHRLIGENDQIMNEDLSFSRSLFIYYFNIKQVGNCT